MAQPQPQQSGCYRCCCPPCAVMEIEGCSCMAVCCWIGCFTIWPINGCINLCYTPVPKEQPVVAQQGYAQPAQQPVPANGTKQEPYGV